MEVKYSKTKKQIADEYGICTKTLCKWIKSEQLEIKRGLIKPKDQDLIYKKFGIPKSS